MTLRDRFNFERQFTFYASYHNNPVNQWIHFGCIWPILFTFTVMLATTPSWVDLPPAVESIVPSKLSPYLRLNGSLGIVLMYVPWYLLLDLVIGTIASVGIVLVYLGANFLAMHSEAMFGYSAMTIAITVNVLCWLAQFYGHWVYEKRAPALFDSLDQAIITAPLFVVCEVYFALGFRKDFFNKVQQQVEKNVDLFHHGKQK